MRATDNWIAAEQAFAELLMLIQELLESVRQPDLELLGKQNADPRAVGWQFRMTLISPQWFLGSGQLTLGWDACILSLDYTHRLRHGEGGEYLQEGWPRVNPPFHLPKEVR